MRLAGLLLLLTAALLFGGASVSAHEGHKAKRQGRPAAAALANPTAQGAGTVEAPVEMNWPTALDEPMAPPVVGPPKTVGQRLTAWLGMWHPAAIHFPIALLLTVAFLELAATVRKKPIYTASNKILLAVAVIGAFIAAPLGWANAGVPAADDEMALISHRWIGTAIPFLLLLVWYLKRPAQQAAVRLSSRRYELLLALSVLVILLQAFLGGEITHGANHMAF